MRKGGKKKAGEGGKGRRGTTVCKPTASIVGFQYPKTPSVVTHFYQGWCGPTTLYKTHNYTDIIFTKHCRQKRNLRNRTGHHQPKMKTFISP